jgi:hypothetical protein
LVEENLTLYLTSLQQMNFVNQCLVFVQWRIVVEETVLKINRVKKQSQYYLKTAVLNIFSHIKARVENSYSENWYEVFGKTWHSRPEKYS